MTTVRTCPAAQTTARWRVQHCTALYTGRSPTTTKTTTTHDEKRRRHVTHCSLLSSMRHIYDTQNNMAHDATFLQHIKSTITTCHDFISPAYFSYSPRQPPVPHSQTDWSSQHGSESATLEAAGCEWRRTRWWR